DRYCKNLTRLSDKINSAFWEGRCSISPNGRELYFSSSRPCGYGGKDLYKVTQNDLGNWNEAVNLGSSVNTKYDEDAPFIHPDNQTLYFSSNGHNTIGGYDIFKSHFNYVDNKWSDPQNMGHPINTTGDDINFVLSADGKFGYFASSQKSKYGTYDIYKLNLNRTIPLTLVKGIITSGDPPKPLKANIRVFDVEKNERVKYIYNPNPESGKYLMIFPPGKNYNMVIEAENFLPHILNIYIPEQNYFYELFQEINMTPISLNSIGKVIGEEISVKNLFYDIYKAGYLDSVYTPDDTTIKKDYTKLLQLIEELIEKTDSIGLEKLDKYSRGVIDESSEIRSVVTDKSYAVLLNKIEMAIELSDSISLEKLNEQTIYEDNTTKQYMYGIGNSTDSLVTLIIGNDTIITLAPLILNDNIKGNDLLDSNILKSDISGVINKEIKNSNKKMRSYKLQYDVYFESNSYKVTEQYFSKLDDIVALLINNNVFGVEINGYSDTSGDSENNKKLSEQRAMQIAKYFNSKNINTDRLIVFGFGENDFSLENSDNEKQKNRRVEILVFSIIDKN
ncbi:MAG: OmpA family protein, partial [Bacteroidota bacterium]